MLSTFFFFFNGCQRSAAFNSVWQASETARSKGVAALLKRKDETISLLPPFFFYIHPHVYVPSMAWYTIYRSIYNTWTAHWREKGTKKRNKTKENLLVASLPVRPLPSSYIPLLFFYFFFLLGPCNVGIIANCVEENRADAELKCNKKKEKVKKRISNENTK